MGYISAISIAFSPLFEWVFFNLPDIYIRASIWEYGQYMFMIRNNNINSFLEELGEREYTAGWYLFLSHLWTVCIQDSSSDLVYLINFNAWCESTRMIGNQIWDIAALDRSRFSMIVFFLNHNVNRTLSNFKRKLRNQIMLAQALE